MGAAAFGSLADPNAGDERVPDTLSPHPSPLDIISIRRVSREPWLVNQSEALRPPGTTVPAIAELRSAPADGALLTCSRGAVV